MAVFLISSMVSGLLDQPQILTVYLIELLGHLTVLQLLKLFHLTYPRHLTELGMLAFSTNLSLMKFQVSYLALFLLFSVIRWFQVVLNGKSSQEYPVNAEAPEGSILGPTLLLLYTDDLPDDIICNIVICADDTTLYSKCDQASDLWQQLELASGLESDLQDTLDWGRK